MLISSVLPIREKTNIIHKSTCNNIQDNTKYNKNFNNELKNSNYLNVFYIPNFKGNINPVCNYISSADALKIQTTEFVYEIEEGKEIILSKSILPIVTAKTFSDLLYRYETFCVDETTVVTWVVLRYDFKFFQYYINFYYLL